MNDVFYDFRDGKTWYGVNGVLREMNFYNPERGMAEIGGAWFTNIKIHGQRRKILNLQKSYFENPSEFPKYDNFDAINVDKTADIPKDYFGLIGVPFGIFEYEHDFKILDKINKLTRPQDLLLNGKAMFNRFLIQRKA